MAIQFLKKSLPLSSTTISVFGHIENNEADISEYIFGLLGQSARTIDRSYSYKWGSIVVSGEMLNIINPNIYITDYICPIQFVTDKNYAMLTSDGMPIFITGWEAGVALMIVSLEEFSEYWTYLGEGLDREWRVQMLKKETDILSRIPAEVFKLNARIRQSVLLWAAHHLNFEKVFKVIG